MRDDFLYLSGLIDEFFRGVKVGRALSIIEDQGITGWETWFQVEFAYFLSSHDSDPEWYREWPVELDRRMEKNRYFCRPDFILRKKGWRKESYVALEMKQHPEPTVCISNMIKDVEKLYKAKTSSLDIRTFWVLGVHKRKDKTELREIILSKLNKASIEIDEKLLITKFIANSNYSYTIF